MCGGFLMFMKSIHEKFMAAALKEAEKAYLKDEVPIGCVIVWENKIIARGHNLRERKNDPTSHAEIEALKKAAKKLNSWRLNECDLYVTIEPCAMCAGAILWSRIKTVYYGSKDEKGGALGSSFNLYEMPSLNHYPSVVNGICAQESAEILQRYFKSKRQNKNK